MSKTDESIVDLHLIFRLFILNWKLVLGMAFLGAFLGWGLSKFVITPKYKATAVIIVGADGGNVSGSLRSVVNSSPLSALMGISGGGEALAKYVELLNSRSLTSKIVDEKKLLELFKVEVDPMSQLDAMRKREGLVDALMQQVKVEPVQTGNIVRIEYKNTDPEVAKQIVDYYLQYLQAAVSGNLLSQAKLTENFIRERLAESQQKLTVLEGQFISLQKSKGVIQLPSQLGMSLNTASQFRAQLIQKEMEIELYKNVMRDSSEVKRLEMERNQIQNQLDKLVQGGQQTKAERKGKIEVFTPLSQGPVLEMEFSAAEREYVTQVKLVELLRQQLELAQIETKRQEPTFQVIDPPIAPMLPYSPNARLNAVIGAILFMAVSLGILLYANQSSKVPVSVRKILRTTRPALSLAQR